MRNICYQKVDAGKDKLGLALFRVIIKDCISRNKISKPNRGQGNERKVGPFQKAPIFPGGKNCCTKHDVSKNKCQNWQHWNPILRNDYFGNGSSCRQSRD